MDEVWQVGGQGRDSSGGMDVPGTLLIGDTMKTIRRMA